MRRCIVPLFFLIFFWGSLIEPGDLGISDVGYRLQAAHSLWTGEPQVRSEDYVDRAFFPIGHDGLPRIPWGIGQSLVMLPADIIASSAISFIQLPKTIAFKVRLALVGYLTFPIISALAVAIAVLVLRSLGFTDGVSFAGGIALFLCTSLFHYTQIHQENSCLLLFDLIRLLVVTRW